MDQRSFYMTFFRAMVTAIGHYGMALAKLLTLTILLALAGISSANQFHDLAALQESVTGYLQTHYSDSRNKKAGTVRVDILVGNLDPRLKLARCEQPLEMTVSDPDLSGGNLTVHTRCDGIARWSVYVPAQVSLFRTLPVANRNLGRGDIITALDVVKETVDTSQLRQGLTEKSEHIIGQEVKRPINKGEPFRTAALDFPMVIKRGDPVIIELQAGPISVSSSGTAMANGRIGERIRVRNSQSDRVVNAQVIAAGKVLTLI